QIDAGFPVYGDPRSQRRWVEPVPKGGREALLQKHLRVEQADRGRGVGQRIRLLENAYHLEGVVDEVGIGVLGPDRQGWAITNLAPVLVGQVMAKYDFTLPVGLQLAAICNRGLEPGVVPFSGIGIGDGVGSTEGNAGGTTRPGREPDRRQSDGNSGDFLNGV